MDTILSFSNEHRFLSSFYPCSFIWRGLVWQAIEYAFQAAKNMAFAEAIRKCAKPGEAKRLGRHIPLPPDWDRKKLDVMGELVRIKFNMPRFKDRLLATEDALLVEGNRWHDNFWGDCYCPDCLDKDGANHLGKILMRVREELRNDCPGTVII